MSSTIAQRYIDEKAKSLEELATKIWENPEIAYQEFNASKWTAEYLNSNGFNVELSYLNMPTAIRASWGSGKPVIGLLGEYDALGGMSQKVSTIKEAATEKAAGQGCGHNLLGVAHVGAAIGLKKEMEEKNLPGTVVFYGCPAEEVLTGKVFMAREGAFRELDIAFAFHPGANNDVTTGRMTAMNSAKFHFKGRSAHAGAEPHNGRSALDAVELFDIGANFLREHVTSDVRIHYVITDGGQAPNIVPDKASVWYYVRALSREGVENTYNRLLKIAEGATMATETQMSIEFLGGCYETLQNKVLVKLIHESMTEVERPIWSEQEINFARELNKSTTKYDELVSVGKIKEGIQICSEVLPIKNDDSFGSTDVADVEHLVPGVLFMTACSNIGAAGHSWQNAACAGSSIGIKGMIYGAKVMALAGIKAIENPEIVKKAKEEFDLSTKNKKYVCPIADSIKAPYN